jgi:hypothetical protein
MDRGAGEQTSTGISPGSLGLGAVREVSRKDAITLKNRGQTVLKFVENGYRSISIGLPGDLGALDFDAGQDDIGLLAITFPLGDLTIDVLPGFGGKISTKIPLLQLVLQLRISARASAQATI